MNGRFQIKKNDYSLEFIFLFILAFSGNASIFGFDLFFFALGPLMIFIALKKKITIHKKYFAFLSIPIILILITFIISNHLNVSYGVDYVLWNIKSFFVIAVLFLIINKINLEKSSLLFILFFIFLFFIASLTLGTEKDGRYSFIFGPNNFYRTISAFGFIGFLILIKFRKYLTAYLFILPLSLYILAITGSRGAVILVLLFFIIFLLRVRMYYVLFMLLILIVLSTALLIEWLGNLIQLRLLDFSNILQSTRILNWQEIFLEAIEFNQNTYDDFEKYVSPGFLYPHNIFLELIYFYGIFGFLFSLYLLIGALYSCKILIKYKTITSIHILSIFYLAIFTGSMFSGDLTDNYFIISSSSIIIYFGKFFMRRGNKQLN